MLFDMFKKKKVTANPIRTDLCRYHIVEETIDITAEQNWHLKDTLFVPVDGKEVAFRVEHISDTRIYFVAAEAVGESSMIEMDEFLDDYLKKMPAELVNNMCEMEHIADNEVIRKGKVMLLSLRNIDRGRESYFTGPDDMEFDGLKSEAERARNFEGKAACYWLDSPVGDGWYENGAANFCDVCSEGWDYQKNGSYILGVVPCFSIPRKSYMAYSNDNEKKFRRQHYIVEERFDVATEQNWHLKDTLFVPVDGKEVAFRVEHISDTRIYFVAAEAVGESTMMSSETCHSNYHEKLLEERTDDMNKFLDEYLKKMPRKLVDNMCEIEHCVDNKVVRKSKLTLMSEKNVGWEFFYKLTGADDIEFDGLKTEAERTKNHDVEYIIEGENTPYHRAKRSTSYWLDTPSNDPYKPYFVYVSFNGRFFGTEHGTAKDLAVIPCFALARKEKADYNSALVNEDKFELLMWRLENVTTISNKANYKILADIEDCGRLTWHVNPDTLPKEVRETIRKYATSQYEEWKKCLEAKSELDQYAALFDVLTIEEQVKELTIRHEIALGYSTESILQRIARLKAIVESDLERNRFATATSDQKEKRR